MFGPFRAGSGGQLESRGKVSCCLGPREFQAAGAHRTAKGSSSGGTLTTSNVPYLAMTGTAARL